MKSVSLRGLFLKNAFANVVGGIGSALFNLILPALVVRHLPKAEFSVWILVLQVIIYLQMFGFGLQTAMTFFIARGNQRADLDDQKRTVKAGIVLSACFAALAVAAVAALVLLYPLLIPDIPGAMVGRFRLCIALLGVSAAWQLLALIPVGIFVGLHRNIVPVGAQLLIRLLSLFGLWLALEYGAGLLGLSVVLAATGALLVPLCWIAALRWARQLVRHVGGFDRARFRELFHFCAGLAVWNLAMMFVTGIDVLVVGHFEFAKVAAFSLAATVISVMVGVLQALLNPLVAIGSAIHAQEGQKRRLDQVLTWPAPAVRHF
jgi:O-antigen/teichoic acid export membrane protein